MNVLGIETSCDETSAAVVSDGRLVRSAIVYSQDSLHRPYGGVVPELASRNHVQTLPGIIRRAISESGMDWNYIDAVAVTYGPGLSSSLLVGLSAAKALSISLGKPLVGINHLHAHIYSIFLGEQAPAFESVCPFIGLVVSGGHTCLVRVKKLGDYTLLGETMDDAAGEAFDKGANLLNLGYPGGPAIDRAASGIDPRQVRFPRGRQSDSGNVPANLDSALCFSFSGVKTALLYYLREHPPKEDGSDTPSIAAGYQEAIVDALVKRCGKALDRERHLVVAGGVSLNSRLRTKLADFAAASGITLHMPEPRYCADNAAMVAGLAGAGQGVRGDAAMDLDASPNLPICP